MTSWSKVRLSEGGILSVPVKMILIVTSKGRSHFYCALNSAPLTIVPGYDLVVGLHRYDNNFLLRLQCASLDCIREVNMSPLKQDNSPTLGNLFNPSNELALKLALLFLYLFSRFGCKCI